MDKTPETPPKPELVSKAPPRPRTPPPPKTVTTREFIAPVGGVVEGRAYWLDGHLLIADATVAAGGTFHALTGTVEYAKVHEEAWTAGDAIFWHPLGGCVTNGEGLAPLPGDPTPPAVTGKVGVADQDAPRPSVTGVVRLDPIPAS